MGGANVEERLPSGEELYIRIHKQYIKPRGFSGGFKPVSGGISADRSSRCEPRETRARPRKGVSPAEDYGVVVVTVGSVELIPGLKVLPAPLAENPAHVDIRDNLKDLRYLTMVRSRLESAVSRWALIPGDP